MGITLPTNGTTLRNPIGIFVNVENSVYVADPLYFTVFILQEGNATVRIVTQGSYPLDVFVDSMDSIYVSYFRLLYSSLIIKWSFLTRRAEKRIYSSAACNGLFIDVRSNLYCSMSSNHQVAKGALDNTTTLSSIVAGNGTPGSDSTMLYTPRGIFVDSQLNLYIADSNNNRIQRFALGQFNATTVAGEGASGLLGNISLYEPTDITLDADNHLFIVDSKNHRIVRLGPNRFQCLAGCSGSNGSASDQLTNPRRLSFDSYGNIFVTDRDNKRIQKFLLATNSCGKFIKNSYSC